MADPNLSPNAARSAPSEPGRSGLFTEPAAEARRFPVTVIAIAASAVLLVVAGLLFLGRRHGAFAGSPDALRPPATYAPNLKLSGLAMSESTSFSGGKSTFIDGHVTNAGPATVTGVTLQVLFASDAGGPPQLETVPLSLVRTRKPYLDVEPVSAAPLAPGAEADFRLIFEGIRPAWDQQMPAMHVVEVTTR